MDKLWHGFSSGKQLVFSCLHCMIDKQVELNPTQ